MTEREEMPARLRRISSHQITHERAAQVIEELTARLRAAKAETMEALGAVLRKWGFPDSDVAVIRADLTAALAPDRTAVCVGYPDCDGDLEGEPHEPNCPAAPTLGKFDQNEINAKAEALRLEGMDIAAKICGYHKACTALATQHGASMIWEQAEQAIRAEIAGRESPTEQLVAERVGLRGPHVG